MPSLDTIRTITIKGQADGVDQTTAALKNLTDAIKSANDNLAKGNSVQQDNAAGWGITGEGALTAANHLRQAAEAAYAFSPAFRGVVNEMAPAALGAANTALAAVAAGIVTATNYAGTGVIALAGAAEKASPALLGYTSGVRSAGIAMEAFSPSVGGAAGSLLSFLSPALRLVGWFALAVDGIRLVGEAWTLGGQKLAEYVALSEKAVASGVSTDFFQRITKASQDAKVPVDALITALANLDKATQNQLGAVDSNGKVTAGNSAQARLDQLTGAGNFQGNSGVSDLKNATDTETKYRAVLSLINQAIDSGQRLAALDVAKTFLGQPAADAIAKSSSSAKDMLASIDKISSETLTSQADVDRANLLKKTYDDAVTILEQRWHPIQGLLIAGGIEMQAAWVNIVSSIASAVDEISKLLDKTTQTDLSDLKWFAQKSQGGLNAAGSFITGLTTTPESRSSSEKQFGIESLPYGPQPPPGASFQERLGQFGGAASMTARNIKDSPLYKDTSKPVPDANSGSDTSAYDKAESSITKYIETTKAASLAVSDAAGEQEKFKAIAELTAAGIKDGLTPEAAKLKANMSDVAVAAGAAADALAKAKIASSIQFNSKTSLLSADDVAIATQLKTIYPDVATALHSVEAAGIRTNTAMKTLSSSLETNLTSGLASIANGTKSVSAGFRDMATSILNDIEQMVIKMAIVQPLMQSFGLGSLGSLFTGSSIAGAAAQTTSASTLANNTGGAFFGPGFATGTDSAPGGWAMVGEKGPELVNLPKGSQVLPYGQSPANSNGQNVIYNINASGADSGTVQRIQSVLAQHAKAISGQGRAMQSAQRYQTTGVG